MAQEQSKAKGCGLLQLQHIYMIKARDHSFWCPITYFTNAVKKHDFESGNQYKAAKLNSCFFLSIMESLQKTKVLHIENTKTTTHPTFGVSAASSGCDACRLVYWTLVCQRHDLWFSLSSIANMKIKVK